MPHPVIKSWPQGNGSIYWPLVGFQPSDVSGLVLELYSESQVYQDQALTTPVGADSDPVGGWKDLSGGGYVLGQTTGAAKGVYKLNQQNGYPAVQFSTTQNMGMTANFSPTLPQPYSMFAVMAFATGPNNIGNAIGHRGSAGPTFGVDSRGSLTAEMSCWATGSAGHVASVDTRFHVYGCDFNGASSLARVDAGSYAAPSANPGTDTLTALGLNETLSTFSASFKILCLLVYSTPPTSAQKVQIFNWANAKYKLYALSADSIFDPQANVSGLTYDHDKIFFTPMKFGPTDYRLWYTVGDENGNPALNIAYATSTDGLNWTKPNLGQVTYGGNTNNNLQAPGGLTAGSVEGGAVVYDASALSGQKFVHLISISGGTGGLWLLGSNDGVTWTSIKTVYVSPATPASAYREGKGIAKRQDGHYVAFYTTGHGSDLRSVGRFVSDTTDATGTWTDAGICTGLQATDPSAQFYSISPTVFTPGGTWYGAVPRYDSTTGFVSMELWTSSDEGATWTLSRSPWVPLGGIGEWDSVCIFDARVIDLGGGNYRKYYSAGSQTHANYPRNEEIGIANVPFP